MRVETLLRVSRLTRQLQAKNQELELRTVELSATNERLQEEIDRRQRAEVALDAVDKQLSDLSDREARQWGIEGFIGRSRTLGKTIDDIKRLRNFGSVNVVITGESGTGKELVARAIHFSGARGKGPFVPINCVAIPQELAESMLFGHLRGAFTGATMDRRGYFEMAHGGTLFLDEIGDMPMPLQAKLLRVLEDGLVTPVGAARPRRWTCGSWRQPTPIFTRRSPTAPSARTFISGWRSSPLTSRRSAIGAKTSRCWRHISWDSLPRRWESPPPRSSRMRSPNWRRIPSAETSVS